ncbi:MAG: (d)CMP kinase [Sedimentisphaerales bacterium]|jgi:cytidylate kinase
MSRLVITIDGPAASGKSTVARLLADKLNATFLDTGAMYRAATLAAIGAGTDLTDHRRLIEILDNTKFEFTSSKNGMLVKINGVDVTEKIRDPQVTASARYVAGCAPARQRLVEMQRQFAAANCRIVSEGRDQGTVAFPDADLKFYLTADLDERARRRHVELKAKGIEQTIDQIHDAIRQRDDSDEKRFVGPLKPAADALIVDTTCLTVEEVLQKLVVILKDKCSEKL